MRHGPHRGGVTLLELLLALALLVVIGSIAWPVVSRSFANQRLRGAADQLRADLGLARVRAINGGGTFALRFEPQSDRYSIELWHSAGVEEAGAGFFGDVPSGEAALAPPIHRRLPEGIIFFAGETQVDSRAAALLEQPGAGLEAPQQGDLPWQVLFFHPDGTASTAQLALANASGRVVPLHLRGLTGVVTVGEIQTSEEFLR